MSALAGAGLSVRCPRCESPTWHYFLYSVPTWRKSVFDSVPNGPSDEEREKARICAEVNHCLSGCKETISLGSGILEGFESRMRAYKWILRMRYGIGRRHYGEL